MLFRKVNWFSFPLVSFLRLPRWLQALTIGLFIVFLLGSGIQGYRWYSHRKREQAVLHYWLTFQQEASGKADPEVLRNCLQQIRELKPSDTLALQRLKSLESGDPGLDDPAMIKLMMRIHLNEHKMSEAARYARLWLQTEPHDRMANCIVVHDAMQRGKREEAAQAIEQLGITVPDESIEPLPILQSVYLLREFGRDDTQVRTLLANRLLPILDRDFQTLIPQVQAAIIGCYTILLNQNEVPLGAARKWASVTRLFERTSAKAIESQQITLLLTLGQHGEDLISGLARLQQSEQISREEAEALLREQSVRCQRVWEAALKLQPDAVDARIGMAKCRVRTGDIPGCLAMFEEGLKQSPDHPRLLDQYCRILLRLGRNEEAIRIVTESAERHSQEMFLWLLLADIAREGQRRDLAIDACQRARRLDTKRDDVRTVEASLWLEIGRVKEARDLLTPVPDDRQLQSPFYVKTFLTAFLRSGDSAKYQSLLQRIQKTREPAIWYAAIEALYAIPDDIQTARDVSSLATQMRSLWPSESPAAKWQALAMVRALKLGPEPWDREKSKAAANACEVAMALLPGDSSLVAPLAEVRYRGLKEADQALFAITPWLTRVEHWPGPDAAIIGKILIENRDLQRAIAVLEPASSGFVPHPGCNIMLAKAHLESGDTLAAKRWLAKASSLPMSSEDRQAYQNVYQELHAPTRKGKNP